MRTLLNIAGFLILIGLFCSMAFALGWVARVRICEGQPTTILTIEGLQQALTDTGIERYDPCGVDGDPGRKTLKAWKNWSFDRYARQYFEGEQE